MQTASPNYTVELLTLEDYVWSVEVAGIRMLTEELKRPELINRRQLYFLVDKMIDEGTGLICKYKGQPIGALGALLFPNTFNPEIASLVEVIWYVLPEYRHTRAGAMLLKRYATLGDGIANELTLSTLPSSQVNNKSLEKMGFFLEEFGHRKILNKEK